MDPSSLTDVLFIRLQTSILCRRVVREGNTISLLDWLYGIEGPVFRPFYIVHEWCCSAERAMVCFEAIQLVDPDGEVEADLRMSPFPLGERFWDIIRNYWEVTDFRPAKTGTHEIRTSLVELDTERVLYQQTDPLHVLGNKEIVP